MSPPPGRTTPIRSSSRSSIRSGRASPADDPVAVRNQVSTLKHNIRQQQAQLSSLENIIRSGPRPYPAELNDNVPTSPSSPPNQTTPTKRRSSYEVLQSLAGPDSGLPLPRRDNSAPLEDFKEGVPMSFDGPSSPPKRIGSPTRTLSRIPVSSVGNARALADEGLSQRASTSTLLSTISSSSQLSIDTSATSPTSSLGLQPPSPNPNSRRLSLTPGGTTKVLADLQTGVLNARNALENTKSQLRLSQRSVAQLTRQTEDLKEARERLRLENEGLNNVVARKERLLQEVLERARKAEAEAATLKAQLKSETSTSKKTIREMETTVSECTATSQKAEREYITLRDSIKGLVEGFKRDTDRLREEMTRREEKVKQEAEAMGKKYRLLLAEVESVGGGRETVKRLREEDLDTAKKVEGAWADEIAALRAEVEKSNQESEAANATVQELAGELARLRRLMQKVRPLSTDDRPA
ncbi:hypothetical protein MIND_00363800 [Mycena indigotica]|uniref:SWI5-dependent HO expression protein 3 n=1 Tax=Mycena indigotica TaxID=2126181 RepID=A0A8H6T300_9AGAR|nr:uncharacterized protein MIND_00363800 [Mycena indigotica]KAF7309915.1 hypothetical protein MIND_00363800 [Mycena indigotica]